MDIPENAKREIYRWLGDKTETPWVVDARPVS